MFTEHISKISKEFNLNLLIDLPVYKKLKERKINGKVSETLNHWREACRQVINVNFIYDDAI